MENTLVRELIDAGIHFGHRASRWNPKMKPYIFGKRNLIHIIDLKETLKGILLAKKFLGPEWWPRARTCCSSAPSARPARPSRTSPPRTGMHYVNDRWLGGTLTNFRDHPQARSARLESWRRWRPTACWTVLQEGRLRPPPRDAEDPAQPRGHPPDGPPARACCSWSTSDREIIAVREARKLGIPIICLLDTDSDPDLVDIPIPGNDDAMRAIELIVQELGDAVAQASGQGLRAPDKGEDRPRHRRRPPRPARRRRPEASPRPSPPPGERGRRPPAARRGRCRPRSRPAGGRRRAGRSCVPPDATSCQCSQTPASATGPTDAIRRN